MAEMDQKVRKIKMIDLKNYNKTIEVHSQEELDECHRIFEEAGADTYKTWPFSNYPQNRYFTYFVGSFSGSDNTHGKETIQFKDFIKELNMSEMKYKQGDILVEDGWYRKVLGVCGEVYLMSHSRYNDPDSSKLKSYNHSFTQYELDLNGYELYTPPQEVEMTVAEISEALGKTVKVVE